MTNWEKYFGTPERAAETLLDQKTILESFERWVVGRGALLCFLIERGCDKTRRVKWAYAEWLDSEAEGGA